MNIWIRWILALALLLGVIYVIGQIRVQIQLTRFLLNDPATRSEPYLIPIAWIWSPVPIALLWCSAAFYGVTWGIDYPKTRLVILGVGVLAASVLVAFVLSLVLIPLQKR
jgi:hypothetical protein